MESPGFEIRKLEPENDAGLFREIRLEALRYSPESFGSDYARESAMPCDWFAERLTTSDVLGGFRDDALAGIAGLLIEPGVKRNHAAVLWGMYVRPDARGAGLGRRLTEAILDRARERVELIRLCVTRTNQPARRLYTDLGFHEYGLEKDARKVGDCYFDDILMALDLRPD